MAELKTKPTNSSVKAHFAAIADPARRRDCVALAALMRAESGEAPRLWGPSIVGFGQYHYKYASGHEGDTCIVGFASRKGDLSIYLCGGLDGRAALLAKLGKHKRGKGCLYVKRLVEVDLDILRELVRRALAEGRKRAAKPEKDA